MWEYSGISMAGGISMAVGHYHCPGAAAPAAFAQLLGGRAVAHAQLVPWLGMRCVWSHRRRLRGAWVVVADRFREGGAEKCKRIVRASPSTQIAEALPLRANNKDAKKWDVPFCLQEKWTCLVPPWGAKIWPKIVASFFF
jgi:hypothetical protein